MTLLFHTSYCKDLCSVVRKEVYKNRVVEIYDLIKKQISTMKQIKQLFNYITLDDCVVNQNNYLINQTKQTKKKSSFIKI